jgi:sporulation protein YlmC with PRC-barrel domain
MTMFTQQQLNQIVEGMEVYDSDGARLGTVEAVRLGEGTLKASSTDIVTMAEAVTEALGGRKDLPTILYSRLYEEGFIRVNRGLLRRDAIVFPHQIDDVGEESIYLKVEQNELTKI